jgi:hypothetical protein
MYGALKLQTSQFVLKKTSMVKDVTFGYMAIKN